MVISETRQPGVIAEAPMDSADEGIVRLQYIHRHAEVRPGQTVVTSGLGGVLPAGIHVGGILDSRSVGFGLYQEARVKLRANIQQLEYVWVLTNHGT